MSWRWLLLCLAVLSMAGSTPAVGWRVFGESRLNYVELRQLKLETIPLSQVPGSGPIRQLPDGRWVQCDEGDSTCSVYESGSDRSITPMLHDLRGTAWMRGGWSAGVQARVRSVNAGDGEIWPRAEDDFDLLGAYVDYQREALALRAGRQWRQSALGYANFDGLSARYSWRTLSGQAYAGYSLLRTVNASIDGDALRALEEFAPDEPGRLFGGSARWIYRSSYRLVGAYERELRDDREGFYGERMALDAQALVQHFDLSARWIYDLATAQANEVALGVASPRWEDLGASAQWRRHRPYFATWTIWNAFAPVSFDEFSGRADWAPRAWPLSIAVEGARREYDEPGVGLSFATLREDGWNAGVQARYKASQRLELGGNYRRDIGPGESGASGMLQARYRQGRAVVTVFGTGFDYVREYRVSGRTVLGGGVDVEWDLGHDTVLSGGLAHYAHDAEIGADFDQTRGQLSLRWQLGADPGRREGEQ